MQSTASGKDAVLFGGDFSRAVFFCLPEGVSAADLCFIYTLFL